MCVIEKEEEYVVPIEGVFVCREGDVTVAFHG